MSAFPKERVRPGGRSARVQESVHRAVHELLAECGRAELTVPMIAARAGVTPSTIYRRWGELADLLADVAVARLRPDGEPVSTGALRGDLLRWLEQFVDEMASEPGRAMVRDVLASSAGLLNPCCTYTDEQVGRIVARAEARGQPAPPVQAVMDQVIAPIMYRIVFRGEAPEEDYVRKLVDTCLARVGG